MKTSHQKLMERLITHHDVIASLIQERPVHYVDIPVYGNIGDLLIMQGTLAFARKHQIQLHQLSAYFNFHPHWVGKHEVVMFQGGGNFGDLYPGPQQTRERTVAQLPGNRIIILPQTIQFKSPQAYAACCALLSRHPDLHIFVRDQKSYELAQPMSRHVYLAPDMAHQLWMVHRTTHEPARRHLGIMRTDDEAAGGAGRSGFDLVTDWPALVGRREILARNTHRLLRALYLAGLDKGLVTPASKLWIKWANTLVRDAINLYSGFEYITTDRLHGHILACLMDIPHTVIDNSYGKNMSYATQWTADSDIVQLAAEPVTSP